MTESVFVGVCWCFGFVIMCLTSVIEKIRNRLGLVRVGCRFPNKRQANSAETLGPIRCYLALCMHLTGFQINLLLREFLLKTLLYYVLLGNK